MPFPVGLLERCPFQSNRKALCGLALVLLKGHSLSWVSPKVPMWMLSIIPRQPHWVLRWSWGPGSCVGWESGTVPS